MRITLTKCAKQFVAAIKLVSNTCKTLILNVTSDKGITFEVITEDRCGYMVFSMPPSDHVIILGDESCKHVVFNLQLKAFIASMRDVSTLNDVVWLDFEPSKLTVTTKTKKSEQVTEFGRDLVCEGEELDIPPNLYTITHSCTTKELEDVIKLLACNGPKTMVKTAYADGELFISSSADDAQTNVFKIPITANGLTASEYELQLFKLSYLQTIIKSTLAKKMELHLANKMPLCVSYPLFKNGYLRLYLSPAR
jgi:hypothetical protein